MRAIVFTTVLIASCGRIGFEPTSNPGGSDGDSDAPTSATNQAPVASPITWDMSVVPVRIGIGVMATAPFSDPDVADTHTAMFNWGDGTSSPASVSEAAGSGSASASHTYPTTGLYTVTFTVTDNSNASAQSVSYLVVNDPMGGYEFGGGPFSSPAGAYTMDQSLAGTAFITQLYARHETDGTLTYPSNELRFSYSPAGMSFTGTGMTWLVMSGNKSWLRGQGISTVSSVNESCYYLLSVVDSTSSPDLVRVKFWSVATGEVIYDTQKDGAGVSAPDDADATQPTTSSGTVSFIP